MSAYNTVSDNWEPVLEPMVNEKGQYLPWTLKLTVSPKDHVQFSFVRIKNFVLGTIKHQITYRSDLPMFSKFHDYIAAYYYYSG